MAFAYDPKAPVLKDVHTKVAPGQFVGIVGPTGGGKSTIVSMIPRFYDPSDGRVLIDGVDLRDLTLQGLRGQIGFVLQDTVLFRGTVHDNIAYGRPSATDQEIVAAAKLANADEFIAKMPDGYHTMVGERGLTLSGGQRQRIGIARAIIRNAPILILDEPTAALDSESEKLVMEALERLMKGRTVLTIAHRLSTIRHAHKILVLKDGVVAEEGTHDELVARNGIYAELYRVQTGRARRPPARSEEKASMSRSLIVMPDDTARPILEAIAGAAKSLRVKMFLFSDPELLDAVIAAHKRGVKVQVMLNPARRGGEAENEATRKKLARAGIEVKDSNPGVRRDAREVDGGGRREGVRQVAQLGAEEPDRDAGLRGRHRAWS